MVDGRSKWTPYVVVVAIQSIYAGLFIFSKAAFNNGVNTYVFIFYRLSAATILLVPIALIDMACRTTPAAAPAMSWRLLFKLFLYALLGYIYMLESLVCFIEHITDNNKRGKTINLVHQPQIESIGQEILAS
uniref:Uncharacterized protein n=1 Tax=Avena sativa TaxID=4498 RepID=A0ACD6APT8_AVESA